LRAPSRTGTYYYGACVDSVAGESSSANNCSDGIEVEVSDEDGGADSYCRDGDVIEPEGDCEIYDTGGFSFSVESGGRGCLRAGGFTSCAGGRLSLRNTNLNGVVITFVAERNNDDSWTIEDVDPEPS